MIYWNLATDTDTNTDYQNRVGLRTTPKIGMVKFAFLPNKNIFSNLANNRVCCYVVVAGFGKAWIVVQTACWGLLQRGAPEYLPLEWDTTVWSHENDQTILGILAIP